MSILVASETGIVVAVAAVSVAARTATALVLSAVVTVIVLAKLVDPLLPLVVSLPVLPTPIPCDASFSSPAYNLLFVGGRDSKPASFHLDVTDIKIDLTDQRPVYPLSCYGPGREAPRQLIEGPVEISPEELRFRYYALRAEGSEPTAVRLCYLPRP